MSKKVAICIADGCEEIEALTVVDLLRRAGIQVDMISVLNKKLVTGSHGIAFETDKSVLELGADIDSYDGIILPGGMPGTNYLRESSFVLNTVTKFEKEKKLVAAICAAPTVLAYAGILRGRKATSFPGTETEMKGVDYQTTEVVVDGNVITSRGMGTAIAFGLEIIKYLLDEQTAKMMGETIVYRQ
ncbi:MAG: DJ-1/PfpI family protein [Lachnospiraceae bacterium]|nr:DJ-1/PfpI family protein [Lachnospiraceae bacterium]